MKFNKSEAEYSMKSIRFLLLTITTMFIEIFHFTVVGSFVWLIFCANDQLSLALNAEMQPALLPSFHAGMVFTIIAGLMIALGFSVYSHYHTFSFFYETAKAGRMFSPSLLSIMLGMFLLIVTLFGFFGSLKQSTCMVNLYALILTIMLILKLVVIVLAFTLDPGTIRDILYIPVSQYVSDPEIEMEIDRLQVSLNCCGSNSVLDYAEVEFTSNHSTTVVYTTNGVENVRIVVPESCCVHPGVDICSRLRERSCKTALVNLFTQNASIIGVLGISVMFIQLLGIIFSLLLARCIRKVKSERGLLSWNIKEQMILARQSEQTKKQKETFDDSVYIPPHESSTA